MIEMSLGALVLIGSLIVGLLLACITAILAKLTGEEVSGWLPIWSIHFLESAVSLVPKEHQGRYREEWRAELAAFEGRRLSGLRFAWRLRRRARSVNGALLEGEGLREVFDAEPPIIDVKPLDASVVSEIVLRAVERTKPTGPRGEEILRELLASLASLDVEQQPDEVTSRYLARIQDWRREEQDSAPDGMRDWRNEPLSGVGPTKLADDVARRHHASILRRRLVRRRRFPFFRR